MAATASHIDVSSFRSSQSLPRYFAKSSARSAEIHVGACTPLVTKLTGRSAGAVLGHIGPNMLRVTSPCSWLTALVEPEDRIASAVMLNIGPAPLSYAPSARNLSRFGPI